MISTSPCWETRSRKKSGGVNILICEADTDAAKNFCKAYSLKPQFQASETFHTKLMAGRLGRWWKHRMSYFFDIYQQSSTYTSVA